MSVSRLGYRGGRIASLTTRRIEICPQPVLDQHLREFGVCARPIDGKFHRSLNVLFPALFPIVRQNPLANVRCDTHIDHNPLSTSIIEHNVNTWPIRQVRSIVFRPRKTDVSEFDFLALFLEKVLYR